MLNDWHTSLELHLIVLAVSSEGFCFGAVQGDIVE